MWRNSSHFYTTNRICYNFWFLSNSDRTQWRIFSIPIKYSEKISYYRNLKVIGIDFEIGSKGELIVLFSYCTVCLGSFGRYLKDMATPLKFKSSTWLNFKLILIWIMVMRGMKYWFLSYVCFWHITRLKGVIVSIVVQVCVSNLELVS